MKVGFSGTRDGMTQAQAEWVEDWLVNAIVGPDFVEVHQGCCVGADAEFAEICGNLPGVCIMGHPSNLNDMTSEHALACCDEILPALPPLERNRAIVDATDVLLACPKELAEQRRGGTWMTVRYARKRGKNVWLILADGTVKEN